MSSRRIRSGSPCSTPLRSRISAATASPVEYHQRDQFEAHQSAPGLLRRQRQLPHHRQMPVLLLPHRLQPDHAVRAQPRGSSPRLASRASEQSPVDTPFVDRHLRDCRPEVRAITMSNHSGSHLLNSLLVMLERRHPSVRLLLRNRQRTAEGMLAIHQRYAQPTSLLRRTSLRRERGPAGSHLEDSSPGVRWPSGPPETDDSSAL